MKKIVLLCFIILALCTFSFSDPTPSACVPGTVSSYVSLGATGCTINGVVFSNFTFGSGAAGSGAILPVDTGITITPQSSTNNVGFLLDAALATGSGQMEDVTLDYVVTTLSSSANITDSALSVEASAGSSGTASAMMTECLGGLLPACSGGKSIALGSNSSHLSTANTFGAVSTVSNGLDIIASNGGNISGENVEFSLGSVVSDVPEPASLLLFGTGVLGAAFLLRRKKPSMN